MLVTRLVRSSTFLICIDSDIYKIWLTVKRQNQPMQPLVRLAPWGWVEIDLDIMDVEGSEDCPLVSTYQVGMNFKTVSQTDHH